MTLTEIYCQTAICFLPLRLRAERTFLPPFVLILDLNPCTFARCLFLGWYVILAIAASSFKWWICSFPGQEDCWIFQSILPFHGMIQGSVWAALTPCPGFQVFTGPRAAAVVSRISRRASEKKLCRLLRHFPDAGMVAVSGIVSPCKDANIEIIYKTWLGVKKYLSTFYPRENVDNVDKGICFAQIFDTICWK